ncbi:MAG TPA: cytochrome c [Candidatus Acidoferrales bacterium]|nr:cytochrome c [Candidatus Acidoferrales bacterium]
MSKIWTGIIAGVVLFPAIVVAVVYLGWLPAAADSSSMRFEPLVAEMGLGARIARQAPSRDVSGMSTADLVTGAHVYHDDCAACHGLPNQPQGPVGSGMFPQAPRLLSPDGMVTDDSAGETYWKVKNGIRLSGMPSFAKILNEDQTWQVTAVVKRADKLPPEVMNALQPEPESAPSSAVVAPPRAGKSTP